MSNNIDNMAKADFKPDSPKIELIPATYQKDNTGIYKIFRKENKKGDIIETLDPLSYTPFEIATELRNPDTREVFYEITFDKTSIVIPGSDLANKKGILTMAGHGVNTVESKTQDLCKYIMEYKNLNPIPKALIYERFGWKEDGSFVLGKYKYTKDGKVTITLKESNKQTNAIHAKGTLPGWINAISGMMKYDNQRFKMYNAIVPPILKIINESNHSLTDTGDTSIGKTKTTNVAMSVYGHPEDLQLSGEATRVGMERIVAQFCDLPVNLDDVQNIEKKLLNNIIYMMANGVGKIRGAKTGGLQELLSWHTVGLFTSETPVITESSFGGLGMRVIELNRGGLGKIDTEAVNIFENNIKDNYGTFAPLLIDYILKNPDEIKKIHTESLKSTKQIKGKFAFNQTIAGIAGRMANTYAAIMTAGKIFEALYKSIGGEEKDAEKIVLSVFERILPEKEAETYTARGLNHILSWIAANRSSFLENGFRLTDREGSPRNYKILGNITTTNYQILPSELRAELERAKFSFERLISDFFESGYLDINTGSTRKSKNVKLEGESTKVYSFKRNMVDIKAPDNEPGG